MKQHPAAIDLIAQTFNLTQAEKYFLLNAEVGEGLFFAGLNHVAIQTVASYQEDLLVTTNPAQLNQMEG
jgi:conjugal transfer ATP-binding protein TraC